MPFKTSKSRTSRSLRYSARTRSSSIAKRDSVRVTDSRYSPRYSSQSPDWPRSGCLSTGCESTDGMLIGAPPSWSGFTNDARGSRDRDARVLGGGIVVWIGRSEVEGSPHMFPSRVRNSHGRSIRIGGGRATTYGTLGRVDGDNDTMVTRSDCTI
jgi:hypothetical protein